LEKGATSALTKTSVCGAPGAGELMGVATALVEIDCEELVVVLLPVLPFGASLEAGSVVVAGLRAADERHEAAAAAAVAGRAEAAAAEERTEEEASIVARVFF